MFDANLRIGIFPSEFFFVPLRLGSNFHVRFVSYPESFGSVGIKPTTHRSVQATLTLITRTAVVTTVVMTYNTNDKFYNHSSSHYCSRVHFKYFNMVFPFFPAVQNSTLRRPQNKSEYHTPSHLNRKQTPNTVQTMMKLEHRIAAFDLV
jgi:hypothetical protein